MKAKYWIFILVVTLLSSTFAWWSGLFSEEEPLYIAVSGPMTGNNGKAMLQGIQLYLDQINQQGGRPIKLLSFDDQNRPELAKEVAIKIAKQSQALAVLGHYTSSTSLAAAPIYQEYGIPAISGSATADELTKDNDWYFRTIFNNSDQGALLANYVRKILNYHEADILFDEDVYGKTLAEAFIQTAEFIGLKIRHRWHFDQANFKNRLEDMTSTLLQDSPSRKNIIFFAAHSTEAVEAIVSLRRQGIGANTKFIGADAFSSSNFLKKFGNYPEERTQPGYYSDGTYTTTPFVFEIADEKAKNFRKVFLKKYQEEPMITSVLYYDAAMLIIDAIKKLEPMATLEEKRQQVKDNLSQLSRREDAVKGISSNLFFDKNGDILKSIPIGFYEKGLPIVGGYQFELLSSVQNPDELLQNVLNNQIIEYNGKFLNRARVVYTGIDFNEINEIHFSKSIYSADFFIWFRFKGDFDDDNIEFLNALNPDMNLGKPVAEQYLPGLTTRTYRIKALFKVDLDFHDYPLDKQVLPIYFRHKELTKDNLIYVVDAQGMKLSQFEPQSLEVKTREFFKLGGWGVNNISFFQNYYTNDSTLGMPNLFDEQQRIEYSQFNATISIERYVSSFILKTLLPVIFLIVLGYFSFFITAFAQKLAIGTNLILATSLFHLKLSSDLSNIGYIILIEYFFYLVYLLAIFIMIVALVYHLNEDKEDEKTQKILKRINLFGRIFYPVILFAGTGAIVSSP
ncbi:MAG: ABC transporter substrate-binding protein [Pseudomonadota bacterium]